jgi:predicted nuclease of restriction endonuclease-like (RecB) superfamily
MKKDIIPVDAKLDIQEYAQVLLDIKQRIGQAQIRAIAKVNNELLHLYWSIGQILYEKQKTNHWGAKAVEKLSEDVQKEFPGLEGFSPRNIFRMQAFYKTYELLTQPASVITDLPIFNIPWFHNVVLIQKLKLNEERLWYAQKTLENGWSRTILEIQIESDLYNRQGKAITNFKYVLPDLDSDLAQQSFKDPYIWDFLTLREKYVEKELEDGLTQHIQNFLLELGQGFAFIGRQYHMVVGTKDLYIDMLFYHLDLRCFIVVELKAQEFDARDVGQINLYLSAVDNLLKRPDDKPTIGLLLCKSKDNIMVEYALQDFNKPIGVASYTTQLVDSLPKEFKGKLPTIAEIEAELMKQDILSKKKN